jgi:hypothetical protein
MRIGGFDPPQERYSAMSEVLIIPLAGIMLPVILVPTILMLSHRIKKREWQHKERLRALELGIPSAADHEPRLGGGTVTAIGAGVPAASVLAAFLVSESVSETLPDYIPILAITWGCAFLISTVAIIAALALGIMILRATRSAQAGDAFATAKGPFEPDAYDVVSSRG